MSRTIEVGWTGNLGPFRLSSLVHQPERPPNEWRFSCNYDVTPDASTNVGLGTRGQSSWG